mmetsp:Transcript_25695/g.53427  ORF Transcript_25695/g.53427 Transcript_25695/m.53427 type:complete len:289 (+) Transcript_25695:211-1077(+)
MVQKSKVQPHTSFGFGERCSGNLDDQLSGRGPAHAFAQHCLHVAEGDDAVHGHLQLSSFHQRNQLFEVIAVGLNQEYLEAVILCTLRLTEVGDRHKVASFLQDLRGLGPVLRRPHTVVDQVVVLARQGLSPVGFFVVDDLVRTQLLHVVNLANSLRRLVGAGGGGDIGACALCQLNCNGPRGSSATQHKQLLPGFQLSELCPREVASSTGKNGLVGCEACQGKTHHVLGTQSIPLRHGLCQRQRILCEGARRAAGGVCAAGLTEAQVHDDLVAHCQVGDTLAQFGHGA